ncbi:type II secretion system GspH family protein [Patescibacteria group bacterium]|nr:type II secretion system GspH family protein [Patescibacteria group bacterium]MBU1885189.1 type II secretion system GspH family protein [Patescibacteria group bacterium]
MKKLSKLLSLTSAKVGRTYQQAGFTMIELLVVIAVIGVLAVAVLSSINPIEQINKGRDTRKRANAAQLINALDRFYAIQERYPWNTITYSVLGVETEPSLAFPLANDVITEDDCNLPEVNEDSYTFCQIGGGIPFSGIPSTPTTKNYWLRALSESSEVKASFLTQLAKTAVTNMLYLSKETDGDVYVCFNPASNQFKVEAATDCADEDRVAEMPVTSCNTTDGTIPTSPAVNLICLP